MFETVVVENASEVTFFTNREMYETISCAGNLKDSSVKQKLNTARIVEQFFIVSSLKPEKRTRPRK